VKLVPLNAGRLIVPVFITVPLIVAFVAVTLPLFVSDPETDSVPAVKVPLFVIVPEPDSVPLTVVVPLFVQLLPVNIRLTRSMLVATGTVYPLDDSIRSPFAEAGSV